MRLLVLGGTRFIGKAVVRLAREAGHEVTLFHRGRSDPHAPGIRGDLSELTKHREALLALRPEAVVHCMANSEGDAQRFVDVFADADVHAVVLSSADCYAAFQSLVEGADTGVQPLGDDAPTTQRRHYWADHPGAKALDYDKNLMTDALLAGSDVDPARGRLTATVLRLGMVYGPGDPQFAHRHGPLLRRLLDGRPLVLGEGEQARLWPFAYVDNVAAAIVACCERRDLAGRVFNLADSAWLTWRGWAELYARLAADSEPTPEQPAVGVSVVPDAVLALARASSDPSAEDPSAQDASAAPGPSVFLMDSTRLWSELALEQIPPDEAARRTWAWIQSHPDAAGPAPDQDRVAREASAIAAYRRWLAGLPPALQGPVE